MSLGKKKRKKSTQNSQGREVWQRLRKNPRAMLSLVIIILLIFSAVFADVIADYEVRALKTNAAERLQGPSLAHWFGTDHSGRDMFARVIHGARVSLIIGLGSTGIAMVIAIAMGTAAAYFGGKVDNIISRIVDVLITIPGLLMALAIVAGLGAGLAQLVIALSVGKIASFARMVRSSALSVANQEYIEAAKARGAGHVRIILKYIIPNIISVILIQGTMQVASSITMGATLSFAGLGVQAPRPEWGNMLSEGLSYMVYFPHLVIAPGIALVITAVAINSFGDCLRDAFDPRLKGRA